MLEEEYVASGPFQSGFMMEGGPGETTWGGVATPPPQSPSPQARPPIALPLDRLPQAANVVRTRVPSMSEDGTILHPPQQSFSASGSPQALSSFAPAEGRVNQSSSLSALGKATHNFTSDPGVQAALASPLMELQGVDFSDSKLREKIRYAQNSLHNLEMFQTQIKQFSKSSRDFFAAGTEWIAQGSRCAQKLSDFSITSNKESEVYRQFGDTFGEVVGMMQILMEQMDNLVGQGFINLLKQKAEDKSQLPEVPELQKQLSQAQTDYDNALRKVVTAKQEDKKSAKLGQELLESKERLEKVTKNFTAKIDKEEEDLRLQVLEQMCSYMYSTHTYFLQGHRLLSSLEPTMRRVLKDIENEKQDAHFKNKHRFADHRVSLRIEGSLIAGRAKQGYLFKKSKSPLKGWLIRWVVLADRKLYWYKKWKNFDHSDFIDLTENIKIAEDPTHKLCFSIYTSKRNLHLKASNEKDVADWMSVLRNTCPSAMGTTTTSTSTSSSSSSTLGASNPGKGVHFNTTPGNPPTSPVVSPGTERLNTTPEGFRVVPRQARPSNADAFMPTQQQQIRACPGNDVCAECSKENPDYIVISTGIITCTECASIHKDVRPFCVVKPFASELAAEEILLLLSIGNAMSNEFFECNIPADIAKLNPVTPRDEKYEYIRKKYVQGAFLPVVDFDVDDLPQNLLEAVEKGNEGRIIQLVAYGGDVNCVNMEDGHKSLLHYAVGQKTNPTITITLLLALGAEINVQDINGQTPLHYCILQDHIESGKLLLRLGSSLDLMAADGHNAVQLAHERKAQWFLETAKEVVAIARLDESDALYSRLTKAAKRLSGKVNKKSLLHAGMSHRPSNAEYTAEIAALAVAASEGPRTPRGSHRPSVSAPSADEPRRLGVPHAIPSLMLPQGQPSSMPALSPHSPLSPLREKKWRSSMLAQQHLPKGVQQLNYSPRPRTQSVWDTSSPPGPTSPISSPPSRHSLMETSWSGISSSPSSDGVLSEGFEDMTIVDLSNPFETTTTTTTTTSTNSSPTSLSSSTSSSSASHSMIMTPKRGRVLSLGEEGDSRDRITLNSSVTKARGLALSTGEVASFSSGSNIGNTSPSGQLTPRSAERRVTLLIGESSPLADSSRGRSSSLPKDKLERRPSQIIVQPNKKEKEKILVREESLVNIEL